MGNKENYGKESTADKILYNWEKVGQLEKKRDALAYYPIVYKSDEFAVRISGKTIRVGMMNPKSSKSYKKDDEDKRAVEREGEIVLDKKGLICRVRTIGIEEPEANPCQKIFTKDQMDLALDYACEIALERSCLKRELNFNFDCIPYKKLKDNNPFWKGLDYWDGGEGFAFLPQEEDFGYFFTTMHRGDWSACSFASPKILKEKINQVRIVELKQKMQCCKSDLALDFGTSNEKFIAPVHDLDRSLKMSDDIQLFLQSKEIDKFSNIRKEIVSGLIEPKGVLVIFTAFSETPEIYYRLWNKKKEGKNICVLTQFNPEFGAVLFDVTKQSSISIRMKQIGARKIEQLVSALPDLMYSQKVLDVLGE
jgi:hypothetical protein